MSLRIRQIKGDWWLDKDLHTRLSADVREFYIGLWMAADDAGYLDWDPVRIGAELYPFRTSAKRERQIAEWGALLAELDPEDPHLRIYPCGHARVPKMPGHQRLAAETKQVRTVLKRHMTCPAPIPAGSRGSPPISTVERNGTERKGMPAGARDEAPRGDATEFQAALAANGYTPPRKAS